MGFRGSRVQIPPSRLVEDQALQRLSLWGFFSSSPSVKAALERESNGSPSVTSAHLEKGESPWQLIASWERPSPSSACCLLPASQSAALLRPSRRLRSRSSPPPRGSTSNTTWCPTGPCRPTSSDRKSTRLNSSHSQISYAVFCLKKKTNKQATP